MPLYEEKLISPLAIRFTQEHIKTLFRDSHVVADTVEQIEARPGTGDYDIVLQAPFPQIEIIRWGMSDGEGRGHWFTLDNRRLYCLQRAAVKYWPRRVAAKVDILYADHGIVRRKYDSTTLGRSVTVAHSCKDAPLFRWDWRVHVQSLCLSDKAISAKAGWDVVAEDDRKVEVDDLADVSAGADSVLARALAYENALASVEPALAPKHAGTVRSPTPSTAAASEDSDSTPRNRAQAQCRSSAKARGAADTPQHRTTGGSKPGCRERKAAQALSEITHQLRAAGSDGRLRIQNWNERYGNHLGSLRKFIEARPDSFMVLPESGGKFRVREVAEDEVSSIETTAIAEIRRQLSAQGGAGSVRIDDWNGRFAQSLGPFKAFIRSKSGEFQIVPSPSTFFKVALVR